MVEEDAAAAVFLDEVVAHDVDPAQGGGAVAFELAHHGAGVQVVTTRQAQHFGQHAEVDAVVRVAVEHGVHGAVDVQQHAVVAAPVGQAGVGGQTPGEVVVHDDRRADFFRVFSALVHLFRSGRGHVEVVAFALTGFALGFFNGFLHEVKALTPPHEGLRVDVLVVFGEVQTTTQAFVHGTAVVLAGQTQLGLDGATQEGATIFVHDVALDLDAVGWAAAGLDVGDGEADVFQTQCTQSLEAEHVTDQGGQHVDDRALFEQVNGVGHKGVKTGVVTGHVFDGVGTAFVVVQVGEQVGPHRGPSAGRRFSRHRSGQFLAVHTGLGRDLETGQDVGVLGRVIGFPVSAAVFLDTGVVGFGGHALCS